MKYFSKINNIHHFHIIRSAESRLLGDYLRGTEGPFLDLGCGDGLFAAMLGLKGDIYGVDIDEKALETAVKSGFYKKALKASATETIFKNDFFNTVFSNCAVEHMDGLSDVFKEVRRVLIPGSIFVLTVPSSRFMDVIKTNEMLRGIRLNTDAAITEYNRFHHHVNIFSQEQWAEILDKAGFKVLVSENYLPGEIGQFVMCMDMLYTVEVPGSKELLKKLEKKYKSLSGLSFRRRVNRYLKRPHGHEVGTHLIIKVEKI